MKFLAEALSGKDWDLTIRWIAGAIGFCIAILPVWKCWKAFSGAFVSLQAFRTRTDDLDHRVRSLETFRSQVEEERTKKLLARIAELESTRHSELEEMLENLLEKREKRRK